MNALALSAQLDDLKIVTLTDGEVWQGIPGWEGLYEVSSLGKVRSLDRVARNGRKFAGRILRTGLHPSGYRTITLYRDGQSTTTGVHRLVLIAFVGPAPEGMEACHEDGNPAHNVVNNLRWDTHAANLQDTVRHGTHAKASRTHCPRNHPLVAPNLVRNIANLGYRSCKACHRADAYSRYHHVPFSKKIADLRYAEIVGGAKS